MTCSRPQRKAFRLRIEPGISGTEVNHSTPVPVHFGVGEIIFLKPSLDFQYSNTHVTNILFSIYIGLIMGAFPHF